MFRHAILAAVAVCTGSPLWAAHVSRSELDAVKPAPAQALVDAVVAHNPDMLDVLFHVTPPGGSKNLVVASHIPVNLGEISGDDDLGVARTGKPLVEVQKDGVRIGVLLQMRDARSRPIGAVGLMFPWHDGDDRMAIEKRAIAIRDALAKQIRSRSALFG